MTKSALVRVALLALTCAVLAGVSPAPEPQTPAFRPPSLRVPEGFTIEVVAAPPLVKYPMMACLDERGRLFIAESDGQNLKKDELLRQKPRFVRMLEDTNGDGKFDKSTIFADRMIMPEGALWRDESLYLISSPYLWRLRDTDGDGVADRREQVLGSMEFDGRANQHGPYQGPDGRLYFSGGVFGYDLQGKDGTRVTSRQVGQAGVFTCRADGTSVEMIGQGTVNPVECVFSPEGEMFSTCAIFDRIGGRHDALVHWIRGGLCRELSSPPLLPDTGHRLPALVRWGQVAPSGLLRYRSGQLGDAYRETLFACLFNTHRVVNIRLERDGSTYRGRDEDFLVSPSADFHPTDVIEDADGSLLVLDTGGWLTWGCPLSGIAKPEVAGAIYRIRKTGAAPPNDPRGLKLDWAGTAAEAMIPWLDDTRPAVSDRTVATLAARGDGAEPALGKALAPGSNVRLRCQVVWVLGQIGTPAARTHLCRALEDRAASVRQAAAHALGGWREPAAAARLMKMVVEDELPVRREAATALGMIGRAEAVPALLQALRTGRDDYLEHTLTYALIEINERAATAAGLADPAAHVRRAAFIALDRMRDGRLTRAEVAPLLATGDAALRRAALDVVGRHKGWADEIVELLGGWLKAERPDPANDLLIAGAVQAFAHNARIQAVVADALARPTTPRSTQLVLFEAIGRCELGKLPAPWRDPLAKLLGTADAAVRRQTVSAIAALGSNELDAALLTSRDASLPIDLRSAALSVVARRGAGLDDDGFKLLLDRLQPDVAPIERLSAADSLGRAALDERQLARVGVLMETAGPLELPALLRGFENSARNKRLSDKAATGLGLALVDALAKSPGLVSLSASRVQAVLDLYPGKVKQAGQRLLPRLRSEPQQQRAQLAAVEAQVDKGDVERGRHVFFGNRAACAACHRIGSAGGSIGPDLSKIGQVRTARDLAEAVLFPSATIVNGYESYAIATRSGQSHTGLIRRETAEALELVTTDRAEIRVPRAQIEEIAASSESIMPQGLDKTISGDDLRDLIAYLRSLK